MSTQNVVNPSAASLAKAAEAARKTGLPPVHLWNPPLSGDMDMRIARDGTWFHEGSPIQRPALVKLFSSILKKEGAEYCLVTPVEKWRITVEDAPFVALDVSRSGEGAAQVLTFETHVGDVVHAGPDHPISVVIDQAAGTPAPYVMVRNGLQALIDRKTFYRLMDCATEEDGWLGIYSGGAFFPIIRSDAL
ncbi:DUF1285 domain-containing protein [Cognatishimia sp. SS12]|uniref:DUF1285 domain-containing protein n=1 Tax=Cognatishimia sp. SS12 TaxID=2979465 RepID=UPI00232EB715|nr:DUF1285 domain-containing protein [Cognatishimia sp. SS12]MDC0737614.1 DUF1285 domain-containing protein [Cognatishimia sp. SS12]